MIPFQKIFALVIRTFSRPMLQYFRQKQKLNQNSMISKFFVGIGRKTFLIEHWVNYRMLKTLTPKRQKHHSQQMFLEKGVQTFYQVLFYMIVLGVPFWQLYKGSQSSIEKEKSLQRRIRSLETTLKNVNNKIEKVHGIVLNSKLKAEEKELMLKTNNQNSLKSQDNEEDQGGLDTEEILENMVEVVADEFEDLFDELPYIEAETTQTDLDNVDLDIELEADGNFDQNFQFTADDLEQTIDMGSLGSQVSSD